MKAYKASYNGTCRDLTYEVGKTYETDNIKICHRGFHACREMIDTLNYYDYNNQFVLFEVELLGEIIEKDDKLVTDKIKIVRIVSREEYDGFKFDNRGNLLYMKFSNGFESWSEYDERNNCIHYKHSTGFETWNKYDEKNNCVYRKYADGYECWKKYDARNKCIHFKDSTGFEVWNEYNESGELINHKDSNSN